MNINCILLNIFFQKTTQLLSEVLIGYTGAKLLVVIDKAVKDAHTNLKSQIRQFEKANAGAFTVQEILSIEGGEQVKSNQVHFEKVLNAINDFHICRHSFVLVIGGGALIDMVGYAAAVAHRGVKIIRVPTTVLAQNDAAVGVKNGVNYFGKKNFLGSFAVPFAIINDVNFLQTLSQRDWISGIAEAVKVAALKDAEFFSFLEKNAEKMASRDLEATTQMIYRCAQLHMQHIALGGDPFEQGSSRPLDFGHWAAHKLEQMTNYELRHGEAVAKGIALDVNYAYLLGILNEKDTNRVVNLLNAIGFDLSLPLSDANQVNQLMRGIEEFREHLGGQLTITLLTSIGEKYDVHQIDNDLMKKAIANLMQPVRL